jgi:tetratricopeptide (TPR) repeat protein
MFTITLIVALLTVPQAAPRPAADRFDLLVRADFFAGIAGDEARLQKAMSLCERTLAENPRHAEALVWHGAGVLFSAGQAFQKGDMTLGGQRWERGLKEMSDAVSLEPQNVGVLIPRGATLLQASANVKGDGARALLETAVGDYEKVLELQAAYFATLGDHAKGELLFGLAEGYHRLGQHEKARAYFERILADAPASGQTAKAREWLATGAVPTSIGTSCVGCHK